MSVEDLKAALLSKHADAPKNNEDETNRGVANVYDPPEDRRPGTIDAKWGDHPAKGHWPGYPDVYGKAALEAARDGRQAMIGRLFDSPATSGPVEQALMAASFAHASEGMPHSPLLQRGKLEKLANDGSETLTDLVRRVVGHPYGSM
jgi:hypothetical protein